MTKLTLKDLCLSDMNRIINRKHVDRLKELIRQNGYYASMPIIANKDGEVIDGQHRFIACKELKIEPPIIIEDNMDLMLTINSTQLRWGLRDYVNYYAAKGNEHYIILKQLCKAKELSPTVACNIILKRDYTKNGLKHDGKNINPIKTGEFKFEDTSEKGLAKIERKIDRIMSLLNTLQLTKSARLITAIARLADDKNFVFDTMENKIEMQRSRVFRCSTIQEYTNMLVNIYNYKNSKKIAG